MGDQFFYKKKLNPKTNTTGRDAAEAEDEREVRLPAVPLDSTVVGAHWPQFLKMLEAAVGAPKRTFGPVDAQTAAARLYAQVKVFANDASFEVPMGYAEDKITKVLGSRVLYPSDLRLATAAVGSLLSLLQENPPLTGAMRRKNRVARKQIYLSLAFFFSEGAVCVTRGFFFHAWRSNFFLFFLQSRAAISLRSRKSCQRKSQASSGTQCKRRSRLKQPILQRNK